MSVPTISPATVAEHAEYAERGIPFDLIDVRTPAEFGGVHAAMARNIPLDVLDPEALRERRKKLPGPIYVICERGGRSSDAAQRLLAAGHADVFSVDGGTLAWDSAGLPVVRGEKVMSMERQVRIGAGLIVLLGVGLSFVHPYFLGIAGFVGAGLVFSGVTDTCGMAYVLGKMPWNQATAPAVCSPKQAANGV